VSRFLLGERAGLELLPAGILVYCGLPVGGGCLRSSASGRQAATLEQSYDVAEGPPQILGGATIGAGVVLELVVSPRP
jgi:hypothetical protein